MNLAPSISRQVEYYNEKWKNSSFADRDELERAVKTLELFLEIHRWPRIRTGSEERPRICELGAGNGWLSGILGTFGPTLAVDLSDTGMRAAAERYRYINFAAVDFFNWDYPKGQFDVVVSQEVIEHVQEQDRYLSIAHDLLRPGGHLIITAPNARTMLAMSESKRRGWTNQPIENWPTLKGLREMMNHYFDSIKISSICVGAGEMGAYRVINSHKVRKVLRHVGLLGVWRQVAGALGFGLHIAARGRRRPE